jgi:hypothetical protein
MSKRRPTHKRLKKRASRKMKGGRVYKKARKAAKAFKRTASTGARILKESIK